MFRGIRRWPRECVIGTHTTSRPPTIRSSTAARATSRMPGCAATTIHPWVSNKEEPLNRFLSKVPRNRFERQAVEATICGLGLDISDRTGLTEKIAPLRLGAAAGRDGSAFLGVSLP